MCARICKAADLTPSPDAGEGDAFRTRLTHSIEVAQIARSLARQLHLDEDLGSIPYKDTVEVGVRADPRGRAEWFRTRGTAEPPRRGVRRG